jgi:hypothetical protein
MGGYIVSAYFSRWPDVSHRFDRARWGVATIS